MHRRELRRVWLLVAVIIVAAGGIYAFIRARNAAQPAGAVRVTGPACERGGRASSPGAFLGSGGLGMLCSHGGWIPVQVQGAFYFPLRAPSDVAEARARATAAEAVELQELERLRGKPH